jgi:hypothetical protein
VEEPKEGPAASALYTIHPPTHVPTHAANPRMERPCQIQEYPQKKHHSYVKASRQNKPIEIDGFKNASALMAKSKLLAQFLVPSFRSGGSNV